MQSHRRRHSASLHLRTERPDFLTGLRAGAFADVVVFDPETYAARSTYEEPTLLAAGVRTVLVNGVAAVDNGALTGAAAGRGLAHRPAAGSCR